MHLISLCKSAPPGHADCTIQYMSETNISIVNNANWSCCSRHFIARVRPRRFNYSKGLKDLEVGTADYNYDVQPCYRFPISAAKWYILRPLKLYWPVFITSCQSLIWGSLCYNIIEFRYYSCFVFECAVHLRCYCPSSPVANELTNEWMRLLSHFSPLV